MAYEASDEGGLLPGGRLDETRRVFGFEADFARDLRCIPMVVRFKLDRCGIKLSLKQWNRIGRDQRFRLADIACDTIAEVDSYRASLLSLIESCNAGEAVLLPVERDPSWSDTSRLPDLVADQLQELKLPSLAIDSWRMLSTLQRFALVKLSRPGHDNDNFAPALREFGLLA